MNKITNKSIITIAIFGAVLILSTVFIQPIQANIIKQISSNKNKQTTLYQNDFTIVKCENTIYVDNEDDGDYVKIQDAVENSSEGDIIEVYSGTYNERVIIEKQIILKGIAVELGQGNDEGKPVIDANKKGSVVVLKAEGCIIDGFVIQNATDDVFDWGKSGVYVYAKDCIIRNNYITGDYHTGITLRYNGKATNTQIYQNTIIGHYDNPYGIMSDSSSSGNKNITIYKNIIQAHLEGIYFYSAHSCKIFENIITKNKFIGIDDLLGKNNEIRNNTISYNTGTSIYITNNLGPGDNYHNQPTYCTIIDNDISNNSRDIYDRCCGIQIIDADYNTIIGNNITRNEGRSIIIKYYSNDNIVYNNNFRDNLNNIPYSEGKNIWDNGYSSGGNYWNDYTGNDDNNDGIGDKPYCISKKHYEYDYYPLMTVKGSKSDPPDIPTTPIGQESGRIREEYIYSTSSSDPNNDHIYYLFDWGDGTDLEWIGPFNTDEICEASHKWTFHGNYEIRVKAKDKYGYQSDWSDPLIVSISKNKPHFNVLAQNFLLNHPRLLEILQTIIQRSRI